MVKDQTARCTSGLDVRKHALLPAAQVDLECSNVCAVDTNPKPENVHVRIASRAPVVVLLRIVYCVKHQVVGEFNLEK